MLADIPLFSPKAPVAFGAAFGKPSSGSEIGSSYASAGISAPAARVPAIWPETNVQDWAWPPHGV